MPSYYPPVGFHFRVEFDLPNVGDDDIRFREVAGLSMEIEEETRNEGGENRFTHKFPVRARYPDLVLKRGLLKGSAVYTWCKDAIQNLDIRPTTVWVTLLNDAAIRAVRQWRYTPTELNGVPVQVLMTITVNFQLSR